MKKTVYLSVVMFSMLTYISCNDCTTTTTGLPDHMIPFDCPDIGLNIGDPCDDNNPNTLEDIVTAECDCVGSPLPLCENKFLGFALSEFGGAIEPNYKLETIDKPISPFTNNLLINDSQLNPSHFLFPANYAAFDKNSDRYSFVYRYDVGFQLRQYYTYDYNTGVETIADLIEESYAAPVYLNGNLYAIRYFNDGEFAIVRLNPQNGQIVETVHNNAVTTASPANEIFGSSTTDGVNRLFFLSYTNLFVFNINSSTLEYHELEVDYDPADPILYYGLEYDVQNNDLVMLRIHAGSTATDLVKFNPDNDETAGVILNLDELLLQTNNTFINPEFYATDFDSCDRSYYISEIVNAEAPLLESNFFEINLDDLSTSTRVFSDFRFGIKLVE